MWDFGFILAHIYSIYRIYCSISFPFFPSHLLSLLFFSLSVLLIVVFTSQIIRGHIAGSLPPPAHYGLHRAFFYRENTSALPPPPRPFAANVYVFFTNVLCWDAYGRSALTLMLRKYFELRYPSHGVGRIAGWQAAK